MRVVCLSSLHLLYRDRQEPSCWRIQHGKDCTVQDVYNVLSHPNGFILDCSSKELFNARHVRSAVCMSDALKALQVRMPVNYWAL